MLKKVCVMLVMIFLVFSESASMAENHEKIVAYYSTKLSHNPNDARAYYNRAAAYKGTSSYETAINDYSKVIELLPNSAVAYFARGIVYKYNKQIDLALADLSQAIKLNPYYIKAYQERAKAYSLIGETDLSKADEIKVEAILEDQENDSACNARGHEYLQKCQDDLAFSEFTKAIERNPNDIDSYLERGKWYLCKGQLDLAIDDFNSILAAAAVEKEIVSYDLKALCYRGMAYLKKGQIPRALGDINRVMQSDPAVLKDDKFIMQMDFDLGSYIRAKAYIALGDYSTAITWLHGCSRSSQEVCEYVIADCSNVIANNPQAAYAYYQRGTAYDGIKNRQAALTDLAKAIEYEQDDNYIVNPDVMAYYNYYRQLPEKYRRLPSRNMFGRKLERVFAGKKRPVSALAHMYRGYIYMEEKQYDNSAYEFGKVVEIEPYNFKGYMAQAVAYREKGDFPQVITKLSEVIELDGSSSKYRIDLPFGEFYAYYERGNAYYALKQYDNAIADYTIFYHSAFVPSEQYNRQYALNMRGNAYREQGKYELALADYSEGIMQEHFLADLYFNKAATYEKMGRSADAIKLYRRMLKYQFKPEELIKIKNKITSLGGEPEPWEIETSDPIIAGYTNTITQTPYDYSAYLLRADAHFAEEEYDAAIRDYTSFLENSPDNVDILARRGMAFYKKGLLLYKKNYDYEKVISLSIIDYSKAIELKPYDGELYYQRGLAYRKLIGAQSEDKALDDFTKAIELKPDLADAYRQRIEINGTQNSDKVLVDYNKLIEFGTKDADLYYQRAEIFKRKGGVNLAIADYQQAIKLNPANAEINFALAECYFESGCPQLALEYYDNVLNSNVTSPNIDYFRAFKNRGLTHFALRKYDLAIADLNEDICRFEPSIYFVRGLAYKQMGKFDLALHDFDAAIQAVPKFAKPYFCKAAILEEQGQIQAALEVFQIYIDHADSKDVQNIAKAKEKIIELGGKAK